MRMPQLHSRTVGPLAVLVLTAGLLAGCAAGHEDATARFLVAPGRFVLFNCAQIAQQADGNSKRQRELEALMVKAGSGSAGRLVSDVAYKPEYLQLRGEMADLRQEAINKKCKFAPGAENGEPPVSAGKLY